MIYLIFLSSSYAMMRRLFWLCPQLIHMFSTTFSTYLTTFVDNLWIYVDNFLKTLFFLYPA